MVIGGFTPLPSVDDIVPASKMLSILLDVLINILKYIILKPSMCAVSRGISFSTFSHSGSMFI